MKCKNNLKKTCIILFLLFIGVFLLPNFLRTELENSNENVLVNKEEFKNLKEADSTIVGGQIPSDSTWTKANSPYIVSSNILVLEGVTLTIEPGVVVKFDSDKLIKIDGELIAKGNETEPIIFTSNQTYPIPGDWTNIEFSSSSVDATFDEVGNYVSGSIMQYCFIEYSGASNTPGLRISSCSPFIDHCSIYSNANRGIYLNNSFSRITNNFILNNSEGGIYISSSNMNVSCNIISNNSASSKGGGVYISGGIVTLSGNNITDNYVIQIDPCVAYERLEGGGIYASNAKVNIDNNIISNNSVIDILTLTHYCGVDIYGGGLYIEGDSANITNNIITNNSLQAQAPEYYVPAAYASGGGIYIKGDLANISGNTITSNYLVANAQADGYAKAITYGGGLYFEGNSAYISDNFISGNSLDATTITWWDYARAYGGGIYANGEKVNIRNNNITNNLLTADATSTKDPSVYGKALGGGIYVFSGTASLSNNIISCNFVTAKISGGGSNSAYGGGVYILYCSAYITNNTFNGNSVNALDNGNGGGLYVSAAASILKNNIINNSASGSGGGIYIEGGTIKENIIVNNSAGYEGGGLFTSNSPTIISYNEITDNSITGDGKGGGICISSQSTIHYINIYNNTPYDVYNCLLEGSPDINATNNWWGTTDGDTIQAHIYDWCDDNMLGLTTYIPYLNSPVSDFTPPIAPIVTDEGDYINNNTKLYATWISSDPESGIIEYKYAIGTSPGGQDIVNWSSIGTNTEITRTGLILTWSTKYYFSVKAKNSWEHWSEIGISDGITVFDDTLPTTPVVIDDGEYTTHTTQLHAYWSSSDPESGIVEYKYAIGTSLGGTDIVNWSSIGINTEVTHSGLSLSNGTTYYFVVKARNEQGLWSEVGVSDGIIVFEEVDITKDTIAPKIKIIAPNSGDTFGITAPSFIVEISDANLDSMWYSLNSDENITFTSNGTISQIAWDALSEGTVSITFYANDTAGNVNSKEVLVKKEISQSPPGGVILGYDLFFLIGTICVISIVLIKKKNSYL